MLLSIITINKNNIQGLLKTIHSVISQTFIDYEWIIIDGASTDGSNELIQRYESYCSYWISEPDMGIYNAMNKGIQKANGEYILFLNSGDCLFNRDVLQNIFNIEHSGDIINCRLLDSNGILRYVNNVTLFTLLGSTIGHSGSAFIKRSLFDKYGLYDEKLRIVSDWKWFLLAVGFGNATVEDSEQITSIYDYNGVSLNYELVKAERENVIKEIVPPLIFKDYQNYLSIEELIKKSSSYRIGHLLLEPYRIIRKFIYYLKFVFAPRKIQ